MSISIYQSVNFWSIIQCASAVSCRNRRPPKFPWPLESSSWRKAWETLQRSMVRTHAINALLCGRSVGLAELRWIPGTARCTSKDCRPIRVPEARAWAAMGLVSYSWLIQPPSATTKASCHFDTANWLLGEGGSCKTLTKVVSGERWRKTEQSMAVYSLLLLSCGFAISTALILIGIGIHWPNYDVCNSGIHTEFCTCTQLAHAILLFLWLGIAVERLPFIVFLWRSQVTLLTSTPESLKPWNWSG